MQIIAVETIIIIYLLFTLAEQIIFMDLNELEDKKSMRQLVKYKVWADIGKIVLVAAIAFIARGFNYIDNTIMGTLLGAVAGYSLQQIKSK